MMIRKATLTDAKYLTALTFRSKAHWNYSQEQLDGWKEDLTISADYILVNEVFVLLDQSEIIGYYSWIVDHEGIIELDNLFVDPPHIGNGFGKILMHDFLERIKNEGEKKIRLYSEPQVEKFYAHFGFQTVGQHQSSIKDRFLPIMQLTL
jgi:N-acetylglutamate synthase-like GNAT family acetyltransferase